MRSHNGSIDTTHTPPPLSFYNTFKRDDGLAKFAKMHKCMHKTRQCTDKQGKICLYMFSREFDLSSRKAHQKLSNSLGYWQIIMYFYIIVFWQVKR